MTKLSEKYRAIANLYAYLEARPFDDLCNATHCTLIDDGTGLEIKESLYQELVDKPGTSKLLSAVTAHGIEIHQYDETGCYVADFDLLPDL
jgi:hypothetical protein